MAAASGAKQSDFRRGLLYNRRISLTGTVATMRSETVEGGQVTVLGLLLDNYTACVRIPGALEPKGVVGERARVTGLAMNRYADDGMFLDASAPSTSTASSTYARRATRRGTSPVAPGRSGRRRCATR